MTSKWYGVMIYPATLGIIAWVWAQPRIARSTRTICGRKRHPARWGNPFGFPLDVVLSTVVFVGGTIYFAAYTPQFIGLSDTPTTAPRAYTFSDVIDDAERACTTTTRTLKATHPYASHWWQWPLDLRPIAYYWKDSRAGRRRNNRAACCVAEITSLPNPVILWFGLFAVPFVGYLAYRERNKGYMLLVVAYLLQWLPWIRSPRISFAYHFYVDIADHLLVQCDRVAAPVGLGKRESARSRTLRADRRRSATCVAVAAAFAFFYPLLAGVADPVGPVEPPHAALAHARELGKLGIGPPRRIGRILSGACLCPDIPSGITSGCAKARSTRSAARLFTKISKEIILAAKSGSPDPEANYRLKMAVEKARENNMPQDNIKRAIARATGGDGAKRSRNALRGLRSRGRRGHRGCRNRQSQPHRFGIALSLQP